MDGPFGDYPAGHGCSAARVFCRENGELVAPVGDLRRAAEELLLGTLPVPGHPQRLARPAPLFVLLPSLGGSLYVSTRDIP